MPPQNCVVNLLAQVEIAMLRNISSDEELHERMTKFWSMLLFVGALMSSSKKIPPICVPNPHEIDLS